MKVFHALHENYSKYYLQKLPTYRWICDDNEYSVGHNQNLVIAR